MGSFCFRCATFLLVAFAATSRCSTSFSQQPNDADEFAQESANEVQKWEEQYDAWIETVDLGIFDELGDKIDLETLWPVKEKEPEFVWPEGTEETLRLAMGRFLSEPKLTTKYSFPASQLDSRVSVDMSSDGKLLYIIDKDNTVHIVDVDAGTDKKAFASPIESAYGIIADAAGEHIFLLNNSEMAKVELASEKVVGSIKDIPGKVVDLDRAREGNAMVACTDKDQIFVIVSDFKAIESLPNVANKGGHVAIHPEGKYILGASASALFRWHISEDPHRIEILRADEIQYGYMPITADSDVDRWFDCTWLHEFAEKQATVSYTYNNRQYPFILGLRVMDAVSCSVGGDSWTTMIGVRADGNANKQPVLCSVRWKPRLIPENSAIVPIDAKSVSRLWSDRKGGRVAILTDSDIRVCDRFFFDDAEGIMMPFALVKRVYTDEYGTIQHCADYVRSRNWPEKHACGEDIYANIIGRLAHEWKWVEENPNEEGVPTAAAVFEAQRTQGNLMALVASAHLHLSLGVEKRDTGAANQPSQDRYVEIDRLARAKADLEKALESPRPPAFAFAVKVKAQLFQGDPIQDGLATVKRCMELYPEYMGVHETMCMWLLPRWGGAPGAIHTYAEKIASVYPEPMRDRVYTVILLNAMNMYPNDMIERGGEAKADVERMLKAAETMSTKNEISRVHCEAIAQLPTPNGEGLKKWLTYHLSHYPTPTRIGQSGTLRFHFMYRKSQNIGLADLGREFKSPQESKSRISVSPYSPLQGESRP